MFRRYRPALGRPRAGAGRQAGQRVRRRVHGAEQEGGEVRRRGRRALRVRLGCWCRSRSRRAGAGYAARDAAAGALGLRQRRGDRRAARASGERRGRLPGCDSAASADFGGCAGGFGADAAGGVGRGVRSQQAGDRLRGQHGAGVRRGARRRVRGRRGAQAGDAGAQQADTGRGVHPPQAAQGTRRAVKLAHHSGV